MKIEEIVQVKLKKHKVKKVLNYDYISGIIMNKTVMTVSDVKFLIVLLEIETKKN